MHLTPTALATLLALLLTTTTAVQAQEPAGAAHHDPGAGEHHEEEELPGAEFEFVASSIFRNGLAAARLGNPSSHLLLDSHYYGVETNDIGIVGLSWELRRKGLRVLPGLGWAFGRENRPAPVGTVRFVYGDERWAAEGVLAQSFRKHVPEEAGHEEARTSTEESRPLRHSGIFEAHLSRRFGAVEAGPMVEHIRYREENEWKGGGRAAWRLGHGVKLLTQVLAPDPEIRIGLAWEP